MRLIQILLGQICPIMTSTWIQIEYPVPYDTIEFMTIDKSKFKSDPYHLLVLDLEDDLLKLD